VCCVLGLHDASNFYWMREERVRSMEGAKMRTNALQNALRGTRTEDCESMVEINQTV